MSTTEQSITDHVRTDLTPDSEAEAMIVKARDYALTLLGSREDREAMALIITSGLEWYHAQWTGEVALILLARGRTADAQMWARATSLLDERKRHATV
jgi:hypothetical protein